MPVDEVFCRQMPKCELHAHLTGSITKECLHEIWTQKKQRDPDYALEDPLFALASDRITHNINTFFPLFINYIYKLRDDLWSLKYSTMAVLSHFRDDGVCYIELRTTPQPLRDCPKDQYVKTVIECFDDFGRDQMIANLILSIDRKNTAAEAMETVDLAIKYRGQGVVGVDLCGDPSRPLNISLYREAFRKAKAHGLGVTLHFAEIEASSSEEEVGALLSFQPDRLGHLIHVPDHLKVEIASRKLGLELCPTGNLAANLTNGSFGDHHVREWLEKKDRGPVVLCTDDVGLFDNPLSSEYLLLSQHLAYDEQDLLSLSANSVKTIFGSKSDANVVYDHFRRFCAERQLSINF